MVEGGRRFTLLKMCVCVCVCVCVCLSVCLHVHVCFGVKKEEKCCTIMENIPKVSGTHGNASDRSRDAGSRLAVRNPPVC